jgi:Ca-activated chloride channel family protein
MTEMDGLTFLWIDVLWLLLILPLIVALYVWLQLRRKRTSLRYANLPLIRQALGRGLGWRRHVPPALLLFAVAVLILAVARPAAVISLPSSRATVILAMDTSGSMGATDMEPTRLAAAQDAARTFIEKQPPEVEIGIVGFAGAALLMQAPTLDRELLSVAVNSFDLRRGTAVGAGLVMALSTIFPDETIEMPGMRDRRDGLGAPSRWGTPNMGRSLDDPVPDIPPREAVEPGSYENAVIILLTDGATTTGPDPLEAGGLPPTTGCASTPWASARARATSCSSPDVRCGRGSIP